MRERERERTIGRKWKGVECSVHLFTSLQWQGICAMDVVFELFFFYNLLGNSSLRIQIFSSLKITV